MTGQDWDALEHRLMVAMNELAPSPDPHLLARSIGAVRSTPQQARGSEPLTRLMGRRWLSFAGVVLVGVVVGILIGSGGLMGTLGNWSGSTPATTSSARPSVTEPTASPPGQWVEPAAYSFVLASSCGERNLIGTFQVSVRDGKAVDYQALDERAFAFSGGIDEIPTIGQLMARVGEARNVEYDTSADGHPTSIDIDPDPDALDDEECYRITGYSPSGDPAPAAQSPYYADWSRADLPDPAPKLSGGATPSDAVRWKDGFLAVGTIKGDCCTEGDPALDHGVIWRSADGREWDVNGTDPTFEYSRLQGVVTDGERLLALGTYAAPLPDEPGVAVPALWMSLDGTTWQRVEGDVPTVVVPYTGAPYRGGFVGARVSSMLSTGDPFTNFMTSPDGIRWEVTSVSWAGAARALAVDPDGPVVAVGEITAGPLGDRSTNAVAWFSPDGKTWPRPLIVKPNAHLTSVVFAGGGYLAVGADDESSIAESGGSLWTSSNGLGWSEHRVASADGEGMTRAFVAPAAFLIPSRNAQGVTLNGRFLTASGGATWQVVRGQATFAGANSEITSIVGTAHHVLALGYRWDTATNHPVPQVWQSDL